MDQWYVGCSASHVVCEGPSVGKYLGHSNNIVTVSTTSHCLCLNVSISCLLMISGGPSVEILVFSSNGN
mgnify:CR=1 FL=1